MASLLTFINPLLLHGDSLGTSVIFGTHLNRIADCNINLSSSRLCYLILCASRTINTIPNPPEICRKQVIKTFSTREGWWYIGIKGDGGVKSKGTRLLIEKEK